MVPFDLLNVRLQDGSFLLHFGNELIQISDFFLIELLHFPKVLLGRSNICVMLSLQPGNRIEDFKLILPVDQKDFVLKCFHMSLQLVCDPLVFFDESLLQLQQQRDFGVFASQCLPHVLDFLHEQPFGGLGNVSELCDPIVSGIVKFIPDIQNLFVGVFSLQSGLLLQSSNNGIQSLDFLILIVPELLQLEVASFFRIVFGGNKLFELLDFKSQTSLHISCFLLEIVELASILSVEIGLLSIQLDPAPLPELVEAGFDIAELLSQLGGLVFLFSFEYLLLGDSILEVVDLSKAVSEFLGQFLIFIGQREILLGEQLVFDLEVFSLVESKAGQAQFILQLGQVILQPIGLADVEIDVILGWRIVIDTFLDLLLGDECLPRALRLLLAAVCHFKFCRQYYNDVYQPQFYTRIFPSLTMSVIPSIYERNQQATIYVGNLDQKVTENIVWELFTQCGPVVNVYIPRDKITNEHQGFGFVEFKSQEDADYAIKIMHMVKLYSKPIKVNKASQDKKTQEVGANLFIGNLDPDVDEKMLYQTFSNFGLIISTKITRDPEDGTSKGYGFVSYDNFESSDQAIAQMNNQYFSGKQISVQYAVKKDSKGEKHGGLAERLLAANKPTSSKMPSLLFRPPTLNESLIKPLLPPTGPIMKGGIPGLIPPTLQLLTKANPQIQFPKLPPLPSLPK